IGIERTWGAIADADVLLFLHDLTRLHEPVYAQAEREIEARLPAGLPRLDVYNKADAAPAAALPAQQPLRVSARSGAGIQDLRHRLLQLAGWQPASEGVFIARARHVHALQESRAHLQLAGEHAAQSDAVLDLLAEELRLAHNALGRITGAFGADDLLGEIFSRFCIGK
ncbi:MAG TPA: tRNA uridine-5-carboxymethylaminomethyl(34) synthesis GTPase MnmE, partial [Burkholderiaceae bacterium]|nr:tRNA uridine-5-carboxymethylaminomethyl(34) synthesis GTPase MnmE [Burkholderiaceae bacterium]